MPESKEKREREDRKEDRRKDGEFESKSERRDEDRDEKRERKEPKREERERSERRDPPKREERKEPERKRRDYDRSEDRSEDAERRRRYGVGFAAESFYDEATPYEGTPRSVAEKGRDEMTGDRATDEDKGFAKEVKDRIGRNGDEEFEASKPIKDDGTDIAEINEELTCDELSGEDKGKA